MISALCMSRLTSSQGLSQPYRKGTKQSCHPAHPWLQAVTHRSSEMQMRHTTPTSLHFILLLPLLFHTSSSLAPVRGILIESLMQMADPSEPFSFLNPSFSVTLAPERAAPNRDSPQECISFSPLLKSTCCLPIG